MEAGQTAIALVGLELFPWPEEGHIEHVLEDVALLPLAEAGHMLHEADSFSALEAAAGQTAPDDGPSFIVDATGQTALELEDDCLTDSD
jgi:hypothetical protein